MELFSPQRIVFLSYLTLIGVGTLLLYLPFSRTTDLSFIDILFTATSAVTVTGLNVVNIRESFSLIGQVIILILIQIGGLGYMTLATFFMISVGKKIGLKERMILSEALNYPGLYGLIRFLKRTVIFVVSIEIAGFFLFLIPFLNMYPLSEAIIYALFHSISSFNNAGFSIFPEGFKEFHGDIYINLITFLLVILGGLGFFVINDVWFYLKRKINTLSVHTKLVLYTNIFLWLTGAFFILITEYINPVKAEGWSFWDKLFTALSLSVYSRTAGFSTIDLSILSEATLFIILALMFIGASPGGTGGGIKTTTFAVIVYSVISYIGGRRHPVIFFRRIPESTIYKSMVIITLSLFYIVIVNTLIGITEGRYLLHILFEVVSAFSTVGLSVGSSGGESLSADFSPLSKLMIITTMIVGRVGILSFMMAISPREREMHIKYTEAKILV